MIKTPFYDYFDNFDCDPADCTDGMNEFGDDETDVYYETTTTVPEIEPDAEVADLDYTDPNIIIPSPDDETAATYDEQYNNQTVAQQKCALDDYEIISDVLGSEKNLVKLYSTALCESAEEPLRDVIRANLVECAADQYATYEYMQKRGMYPTDEAPEEKVLEAKQQFTPLCDSHGVN